jgi:hypothetical protein
MAIKPVVGYTGSGWNYPTASGAQKKIALPKPKLVAVAPKTGGGSLASAIGGQQAATSVIAGGKVGAGAAGGPATTTITHTPLQIYQDEILSDPGSVAAQGTYDTTLNELANQRRDAIQRAVIQAGWDPGAQLPASAQGFAGDINDTTRSAAAQNQLSTRAQLQSQYDTAMHAMPYQLAATGMGRSGQVGVQGGEYNKQFQTATNTGMQDLLSSILGFGNTYSGGVSNAASALDAARAAIAQRLQNAAGYSEPIVNGGGDGGDYGSDASLGLGAKIGSSGNYPAVDTTGRTGYSQNPVSGAYSYNPTKTAVAKVIKSIGVKKAAKPPANIYQVAKNMMAG